MSGLYLSLGLTGLFSSAFSTHTILINNLVNCCEIIIIIIIVHETASKQHEKDTLCSCYLSSTQDHSVKKRYLDKLDITSRLDPST